LINKKHPSEYVGEKFGELTIIEVLNPYVQQNGRKRTKVMARCECDGNVDAYRLEALQFGSTTSCGCVQKENTSKTKTTHGLTKHPLHRVWLGIKKRCDNENDLRYKDWGGRGITICDEWKNKFKTFYDWCVNNGWNGKLQIDRINNDGNYEPNNCRFLTAQENNGNKRLIMSSNTSGYRGVSFIKSKGCFRVKISHKNETVYLKYGFSTAKGAAIARDIYCIKNNIPFTLNFPELIYWMAL